MPIHELALLRASGLRALPRDRTLFFFPLGPIEDHGDTLPVGLDLIEARALAEKTAALMAEDGWHCVLAPSVPLGIDGNTGGAALCVRAHVLRDFLVDFCDSLARQGFRYFVALSGNPGPRQLTAIEEAGKFLRKKHLRWGLFPKAHAPILVSGNSVLLDEAEKSRSSLYMSPKEHGGERDVGGALAFAHVSTDEKTLQALPAVPAPSLSFTHWRDLKAGRTTGYWGDPARGRAAAGAALIDEKAKNLVRKIRAAFEGGKPHVVFKSWYSLVPTNQSLFKIWILVLILLALLGSWTILSLQSFLGGADFT